MIYIDICECENKYCLQHEKAYEMLSNLLKLLGYESFTFSAEETGRPYVNIPGVDISVSHSKNAVVVSVATEKSESIPCYLCLPVYAVKHGIDIEAYSHKFDLEKQNKLALRFLGSSVSSKDEFYLLWTKNEAYGKMTGEGVISNKSQKCDYLSFEVTLNKDTYRLSLAYQ